MVFPTSCALHTPSSTLPDLSGLHTCFTVFPKSSSPSSPPITTPMSFRLGSHVHAEQEHRDVQLTISPQPHPPQLALEAAGAGAADSESKEVDYSSRAQWLRAAVLGANDGLVSVASLMIGVGAVNTNSKAMLISGLAGLVAGACSMAIGEFVSVYAQYDIEVAHLKREKAPGESVTKEEKEGLPSPLQAAGASALAFAMGAVLPLLAGGFVKPVGVRIGVVCAATSLALAGFGAAGAALGGAHVRKSAARVLVGGWVGMLVSYGVLRLFGLAFGTNASSP